MKKDKVLLIGWDAADWKIIGPLLAKGRMPALKKIIDRGVYGNMSTMNPPYSPMLWSTVATGKTPDKHGVLGFIEVSPDRKGIRPVTVNSRKSRALWNIFHNQGLKSNVVGWWPSFPAEPIKGVVVSDKFQKVNKDPNKKSPIVKGTIHPEDLVKDLHDLRLFPHEVTEAHILPFIPKAAEIDQEKEQSLYSFAKMLAENTSVHAAATNLMRTTEWDFMAVYYDLIDHFCHAFMKYHPPKLKQIPQSKFEIYKDTIYGAYMYQDMMLERMVDLAGEDTTIVIMSDHGYESGNNRILKMPKYPAAPALEHRKFGMFVAAGPNIKKNEKIFGLSLIDVAPTILHIYGLPVGKDMDGKVALDIFKEPKKVNYIDSWEDVKGDFGEHESDLSDLLDEEESMQQLIDLGYIEKPDNNIEIAILKTSCDLKHNLARVFLGKKDYSESKRILLELINYPYPTYDENAFEGENKDMLTTQGFKVGDTVVDTIPFYMDLLSLALAEHDYDAAEVYLNNLRNFDKKFELNTLVSEAKILLGKGKVHLALKCLEDAKNKNPNSLVWYQIGKIYKRLSQFENAKAAFQSALVFEIDNAKSHQALADILIVLKDYEEAAEHALTAIELVKYFPAAHYTLGQALEKLGDLENAKMAYETASKLKPKDHQRAVKAIENINEKLSEPISLIDKAEYKFRKDQIIIVSGLPRSGTSVMMQMLNNGGIDVLTDGNRKSDESNPKGYYEYEPVMALHKDNSWLGKAQNKTVKVVAPLLKFLDPKYRYKVIFMNRDLTEVVKSQQKMVGKNSDILSVKLFESYNKHLSQVEVWKDNEPGVELIYVDYKEVLFNTDQVLDKVTSFIGLDLDKPEMIKSIDKTLYRNKS
ncbi:alkaline phosphatase family protein [Winogradskyella thalassocola]|uniref:Tetratricopeptide repeat-containing protein n=1 Tax=Winogradskyella thalassocola TaxID=262004 RepID=A0A1G8K3H6_9FLAO|nr:alkaline phosphatase family protein [Winogradskyella thalassocola]SDI38005.1 Tetratricopeptide repeat-containing protein [Winogradskyella thalassocola]